MSPFQTHLEDAMTRLRRLTDKVEEPYLHRVHAILVDLAKAMEAAGNSYPQLLPIVYDASEHAMLGAKAPDHEATLKELAETRALVGMALAQLPNEEE